MQSVDLATFECSACGTEFDAELPTQLDHGEAWPVCCGQNAYLMEGEVAEITAEKAAEYLAGAERWDDDS